MGAFLQYIKLICLVAFSHKLTPGLCDKPNQ